MEGMTLFLSGFMGLNGLFVTKLNTKEMTQRKIIEDFVKWYNYCSSYDEDGCEIYHHLIDEYLYGLKEKQSKGTEAQQKAEEIYGMFRPHAYQVDGRIFSAAKEINDGAVTECSILYVKGIIEEIQIIRTYEPPYSDFEMERLNFWQEVLKELEG